MKPTLAIITLFFLLFAISTKASPAKADWSVPVVDVSGEKLKAGESYYILSFNRARGGISFSTFGNHTCPNVVVQESSEVSRGKPVRFLHLSPTEDDGIYTFRNINIEFPDIVTTCVESGVWRTATFTSGALNVAINGIAGTGQGNDNWFRIERSRYEGAYKLQYCPNPKFIGCNDLGIFSYGNDGKRYVGATNLDESQDFTVVFVKADVKNAINDGNAAISSI